MEKISYSGLSLNFLGKTNESLEYNSDSRYVFFNNNLTINSDNNIYLDRRDSFFRDFIPYFADLLHNLNLDQEYIEKLYCTDPTAVIEFMGMIKNEREIIDYINLKNLKSKLSKFFTDYILHIKDFIIKKSQIRALNLIIDKKYHDIYKEFVKYKNLAILNDTSTIIEELEKVDLINNSIFSKQNEYLLPLKKSEIFRYDSEDNNVNVSSSEYDDLFNEFYNLEEQPYINEARLLKFLHSVWEVKSIIDFENDKYCLSELLKITEVKDFYAITEKLKLITSFEDENFLCMFLQFMKLAKDILKDDILLGKIKIIKS